MTSRVTRPFRKVPSATAECPTGDVEIRVLGDFAVEGSVQPMRRSSSRELLAYLALHREGATKDRWATALWPERLMAPSSLHSTVSDARRALGRSAQGAERLVKVGPRLSLSEDVGTDWERFCELASSDRPSAWRQALSLITGQPFEGLRRADWALLEGWVASVSETVVEVASRLAVHHLVLGDPATAVRAARVGLVATPGDERLYRLLLRAAHAQGNSRGVHEVMGELLLSASGERSGTRCFSAHGNATDLGKWVHPRTVALYRSLSGSLVPASEGPLARL
jgi:hypothetical protein